jgi:hypothetical protein
MKARIVSMSAMQLLLLLLAYSGSARTDETAATSPSDQRLQRLMARFHRAK